MHECGYYMYHQYGKCRGGRANLFLGSESEPESSPVLGSEPPNSEPDFQNFGANIYSELLSANLRIFKK